MVKTKNILLYLAILITVFSSAGIVSGQEKSKDEKQKPMPTGKTIMWEPGNVSERDLFLGPGGQEMLPNLSKVEFIREEKGGHNKKYRIRDANGRIWVAKLGREAQPETAAVRLMWGLGYKTEVNYLVPTITIPGKGTFENVRLEARPDEIDRLEEWKWKDNPFIGTNEFQGLKMMMVFFTNWDIVDVQNKILAVDGANGEKQLHYIISDLGATFGKLGNNNLFLVYRIGRKTNSPEKYVEASFIDKVENGKIDLAYKGKNRELFNDVTVDQGRWLADLLLQLTDQQIDDAFRAGGYSVEDRRLLVAAVKNRISILDRATRTAQQSGL